MKIEAFPFEQSARVFAGQQVAGKVALPKDANIVHLGAAPPNGEMYLYAEVSEVETPTVDLEFCVLRQGQSIPDGYKYRGYILAHPILFVYQKEGVGIIT